MDRCIIIGGGASLREDWSKPIKDQKIWEYLKNEFTIGLNRSYYWFTPSMQMFFDYELYINDYNNLKNLNLVVGHDYGHLHKELNYLKLPLLNNTYLIKNSSLFHDTQSWKKGFYSGAMCGGMALSFAIALGFKEIYLLGYDYKDTNGKTHWFEDEISDINERVNREYKWRGVGFRKNRRGTILYKSSFYNAIPPDSIYDKFKPKNAKIYNVNPDSLINSFEKINKDEFYLKLNSKVEKIDINSIKIILNNKLC